LFLRVKALRSETEIPLNTPLLPLDGVDITGKQISFDVQHAGAVTVLFVLSPSCAVADRNWPQWDDLLKTQEALGWKPVFVNIGGPLTSGYLQSHGIEKYEVFNQVFARTANAGGQP